MLRLKDIHHVVYQHPELAAIERFLVDFGMVVAHRTERRLYLRGTGTVPYIYVAERAERPALGAIAFALESAEDLALSAALPGASKIEALDGPGGGMRVVLTDPGGRRIELVHGIEPVERLEHRAALTFNTCDAKPRRGQLQRPPKGPAQILRLGHAALGVADLKASIDWYTGTLGLLPSDYIVHGEAKERVACFMRLNRGSDWTDHHTVAVFTAPQDHVHHISFEVQDLDAQQLGHRWLASQGWKPFWGIGRHVLGSQIFDYWVDPSGNLIEHFTDSDLLTADAAPGAIEGTDESLYAWGPDMKVPRFLSAALDARQAGR
jgi:catechol 2,3-dioxygenase-like lactoylglutathione lyase family enzyme